MKKILLSLCFSTILSLHVQAQATIAKLKYEEAEEAYSRNDFSTSLEKLREAEQLFGSVTPKTLYLKIAAEYNLLLASPVTDLAMAADLREHVDLYLKINEHNEIVEDKYREVYKISEAIKKYGDHRAILKAARQGDVKAMLWFAEMYSRHGNYTGALEWYKRAAEKGSAAALTGIGYIYDFGLTAPADYKQAFDWYSKAAKMNDALAIYALGCLYYNGQGVPKDEQHAKELFRQSLPGLEKQAKDEDDPFAAYAIIAIADLYDEGINVSKDQQHALQLYERAVAMGSSLAMCRAGVVYSQGPDGAPADMTKAAKYFQQAAENHSARGMYMLGRAYSEGQGVEKDMHKAWEWFLKSAQYHLVPAMTVVGTFCYNGIAVKQDYNAAAEWYKKAADAGEATAMVALGNMYRDAVGVERHYGKAKEYYEKAIETREDAAVLRHLGIFYSEHNGQGHVANYSKALEYFTRAADKGDKFSMEKIGMMYLNGTGVKKDKNLGRQWLAKSLGSDGLKGLIQVSSGNAKEKAE